MFISERMNGLHSAIFTDLEIKKQELKERGREVFDFGTGTPDIPPAPHIVKALEEAAGRYDDYKYAIRDLPELTHSVIDWYKSRYGVTLEKDEVMSLSGSQDGLAHVALTLANWEDTVLVPDPCYPIFWIGPSLACKNIVKMPLLKENKFLIDLDAIPPSVAHAARMMVVSYPNNPVTAIAPDSFYEKLIWFAKKYEIAVIHDNAYSELVYDNRQGVSFLSYPGAKDVGIEFNSLSKSYNMTGCRIAFALGNKEIIKQLKTLKSHLDYGIFLPVQKAAIAALTGPQDSLKNTVLDYWKRRDFLVDRLNGIGWKMDKPPATMFVWAPVPEGFKTSMDFTLELLDKAGVVVVPGSSFGESGEGFVRLALVQSIERMGQAVDLIEKSGVL